jgi:hypothetical protein
MNAVIPKTIKVTSLLSLWEAVVVRIPLSFQIAA